MKDFDYTKGHRRRKGDGATVLASFAYVRPLFSKHRKLINQLEIDFFQLTWEITIVW